MTDEAAFGALFVGCAALRTLDESQRRALLACVEMLHFEPGQVVVAEGARDRAVYFCLQGQAQVTRGGVVLEVPGFGQTFGEVALLSGAERAASVTATSRLLVARLSHAAYRALYADQPELAYAVVELLAAQMTTRLGQVTESVGQLLGERSLPRRARVDVRSQGQTRSVATGLPCGTLLPETLDGHLVVAALLDHSPHSLREPISANCTLEALTTAHWEGQRIYRQSLGLLLLEAAGRLALTTRISVGRSLGVAYRIVLHGDPGMTLPELARVLEAEMRALVQKDARLREETWSLAEAREHFAQSCPPARALLDIWRDLTVPMVSYGEVYALRMTPLVTRATHLGRFSVALEQGHLLLVHHAGNGARRDPEQSREPDRISVLPGAGGGAMHATLLADPQPWLEALGITHVGAFNRACIEGGVDQLIRVNEGFHEKGLVRIADAIASRSGRTRVVCIAGPSSSGKTTFIRRLRIQLQVAGLTPRYLSLDDYYVDRERTPRDLRGELDYEALEALDLPTLRAQVVELLQGGSVQTPRYDFTTGKSLAGAGPTVSLASDEILMLEGIHGLNPKLLGGVDDAQLFRIFVGPLSPLPFDDLSQVHSSDLRLLRRIVRDRHSRATTAEQGILRWPAVRDGERQHIFPHVDCADAVFDTALVYELSVLKVYAERYLLEVPRDSQAYVTAVRLLQLLHPFVSIYPDHVPATSILREFIGGSGFDY